MESILFNGGASEKNISKIPLNLSRLRYKLFGCKNQDEKTSTGASNASKYSEKVLIGNWFEKRAVYHPENDEWITIYKTHYKLHDAKNYGEDKFIIWKNKEKIQGSEKKIVTDGDEYFNNMTSSYDLSYRILPKNLCGPRIRIFKPIKKAWIPDIELARSFGNQTKYGLVEAIKEEQRLAELIPPWQSIYQADFNEQSRKERDFSVKRFSKPRADSNDLDLRHLGIILSPTIKGASRDARYRESGREKMCAWM